MDTRALEYIRPVDPDDPELEKELVKDGRLYIGAVHRILDVSKFPSPSTVINESMYKTGVYIPDDMCQRFDDEWKSSMTRCFEASNNTTQLDEFLTTGKSKGRILQLQVMVLPPGTYFKIHAHPNIEFELTLTGTLEESRFQFCMPIESSMTTAASGSSNGNGNGNGSNNKDSTDCEIVGPTIQSTDTFRHNKVGPGQCMMNEVGSVHQSFTGTESPCAILVMWSGCHANTRPENVHCTDCRLKPTAGW
mmetsp:Transcript_38153/g.92795  ORF Transcript_38153/g.92795 Transcript_38153/m.92795 type:complete len:249 (-) Transcript_38153:69-815(-)